ncbi:hypothetical protein ElyMa_000065700 [Elysia marginata]|uniref:Uncharacterized protein n=1 Tax=Elysia marginata TaxID=1093978 RepID=A0AAV4EGL0_9GAST|nr:hypothetical protein ElyMa_000065700 [Elysia marginata]
MALVTNASQTGWSSYLDRGEPRVLQAHITNSRIACSWVPILQVGGLGRIMGENRENPKAIATWHGRESNPRPPDLDYDALTTLPLRSKKGEGRQSQERERAREWAMLIYMSQFP